MLLPNIYIRRGMTLRWREKYDIIVGVGGKRLASFFEFQIWREKEGSGRERIHRREYEELIAGRGKTDYHWVVWRLRIYDLEKARNFLIFFSFN